MEGKHYPKRAFVFRHAHTPHHTQQRRPCVCPILRLLTPVLARSASLRSASLDFALCRTAPAQKTFTLNFDMEPHVVRNGSETFNEIRFSTGESYKAAIKAIEVSIILPKAFGSDDIVISSSSGSKQWDQTAKEAKFTRSTYTPPGTRYTVSVRYPSTAATDKCNPCSKLPDWLMYVLLSPLVLCFIIPCFASLIHRDQDGSGGGGGDDGGGDFASLDEEDDPSGGPLT